MANSHSNLCFRKIEAWGIVAVLAVSVAVFSPVLNNDFLTHWDDQWMILENPYLEEVSTSTVAAAFTESYGQQYSPLNTMTYMGITQAFGMQAPAFQAFGLLLHLFNVLLVGLVIRKLLTLISGAGLSQRGQIVTAWGVAMLFAIHPLQVEAVAWISASKVLLYSFFYLAGMWCYMTYKQSGKWWQLGLVLLCFIASLLSKEQAVVFLLTLIAIDWVVEPRIAVKNLWLEKIPFFVVAVGFGVFTLAIQTGGVSGVLAAEGTYPLWQRLVFFAYSLWEYLLKLVVPYGLSHFYFFPMDVGEALPTHFWIYPVALALLGWLLYEYRQHITPVYLFGGVFFLINLILVLHVLPAPSEAITADRYIYLSSIGGFLVAVYTCVRWLSNCDRWKQYITGTTVILALLVLMGISHERTKDWQDMATLNEGLREVVESHMGEFTMEEDGAILLHNSDELCE